MENVNAIIGCRKFPNFRFLVPVVYFSNVLRFYKSKQIDVHVSSKLKSYLVEKLYHVFGVKNDNFENNQIIYPKLTLFSSEHLILPIKTFTTETK